MKVSQSWRLGLKDSLVLGLLTLAPLGVTIWVLASVVRFLDDLMYRLIPGLGEIPLYFGFGLPGIGIIATFVVLLATGLIAKTFAGRMFNNFSDSLIGRLPVLSGLYGVTKQISSVFFSQSPTSAFKKVVYVPFPSSESRSLAFVASQVGDDHVLVFVPTAPNPTSGYVLRYHRSQLEDTTITIDAALQLIISCGALGQGKSNELPKV